MPGCSGARTVEDSVGGWQDKESGTAGGKMGIAD